MRYGDNTRMGDHVTSEKLLKDHVTNEKLYAGLPKLSDNLRSRRLHIAGHCVRHPEEAAHHTILWEPTHGTSRRGAPCMNYVTLLKKDTGLDSTHEIETVMLCRETWSGVARCSRASTARRCYGEAMLSLAA